MPALSAVCSNELLDKEFGAVNYTPPASHWLALYSVAPAADGSGGTELPFSDDYARVEIPNDKTSWTTASAKSVTNAIELAFPQANGGDWPAAVAVALKTASTGGTVRAHGALEESVTIRDGKTASYDIGALEIIFA
jgi:hypothetical protein